MGHGLLLHPPGEVSLSMKAFTLDLDTACVSTVCRLQRKLRERESAAIARLKHPSMPEYTTIGIIDGMMGLLLWNIEKPPGEKR